MVEQKEVASKVVVHKSVVYFQVEVQEEVDWIDTYSVVVVDDGVEFHFHAGC